MCRQESCSCHYSTFVCTSFMTGLLDCFRSAVWSEKCHAICSGLKWDNVAARIGSCIFTYMYIRVPIQYVGRWYYYAYWDPMVHLQDKRAWPVQPDPVHDPVQVEVIGLEKRWPGSMWWQELMKLNRLFPSRLLPIHLFIGRSFRKSVQFSLFFLDQLTDLLNIKIGLDWAKPAIYLRRVPQCA